MKKSYIQLASEKIWQGNGDPSTLYWKEGFFFKKNNGANPTFVIGLSHIERHALLEGIELTDCPLTQEQQHMRFNSFKQAIKPKLLCKYWQENLDCICVYLNTGEFAINPKKRFFALKRINKIQPILAAEIILTSKKPQKREIAMVVRSLIGRLKNRDIHLHFHNRPTQNSSIKSVLEQLLAR